MSGVLADNNTTNSSMVSCEDIMTSYQELGRARMAFGCDLGSLTLICCLSKERDQTKNYENLDICPNHRLVGYF